MCRVIRRSVRAQEVDFTFLVEGRKEGRKGSVKN